MRKQLLAKVSPDVLLSSLGLRYDGSGLKGSPAQIVANLVKLTAAYDAGEYHTPNFVTAPVSSATFDAGNVQREQVLMAAYYDSLLTGSPAKVHAAVDRVNKLRMVKSGGELVPQSDFFLVAHAASALGDAARWIVDWGTDDFFYEFAERIRKYASQ